MVCNHLPNAMATAKGHLDRARSGQPHVDSDAVSARRRHHTAATRNSLSYAWSKSPESKADVSKPFDPKEGPRSTILHLDYTGPLPEACTSGTRYFQISCWGGYINIQPLQSLRNEHTTAALKAMVGFFRDHGVTLTEIRMDNQRSEYFSTQQNN